MNNSYIDEQFYNDVFKGEPITDGNFDKYSIRASDVIDQLTGYQIRKVEFENLDNLQQELVKKATAAQVEYYELEGFEVDTTGNSDSNSVSLGRFSYSSGNSNTNKQARRVAPNVLGYLTHSKLLKGNGVRFRAF